MWYFTWILGVLLACAFGIINVLWLEAQEGLDQHTAVLDPLTKLPNRVEFLQQLEQIMEKQQTNPNNPFSLLLISMDAFQSVCDKLGEECLDKMIMTICRIIDFETRRQIDTVARYDARTFAVILSGSTIPFAQATAARIRDAVVEQLHDTDEGPLLSIGIAEYRQTEGQSRPAMEDLLRCADKALNRARQNGANELCCA